MALTTFTPLTTIVSSEVNSNFSKCLLNENLTTSGGVLYYDGTTNAAHDPSNFFYDSTNKRLGIGVTPSYTFNSYNATNNIHFIEGDSVVTSYLARYSTDASTPDFVFRKARGTKASPTAVATSDVNGRFLFQAYGGTTWRNISAIQSTVETYTSDSNISSRLGFYTSPSGSASATLRMTLDSQGYLGIGTSSPLARLHVSGSNIRQESASTDQGFEGYSSTTHIFSLTRETNDTKLAAWGKLIFKTNSTTGPASGTTAITIDTSGNVGIGTASPGSKLSVYDASNCNFYLSGDSTVAMYSTRNSTDSTSSNYIFRKTRGSEATPTTVASSDTIGQTLYQVFGGTNYRNIAAIVGTVETYTSDTNISSRLSFWTSPSGSASTTERLRIQSSGDIRFVALSASTVPVNSTSAMGYYQTGTKFVIWYNDAGTMRYKYLDMSGTGVTWVHTTTAP